MCHIGHGLVPTKDGVERSEESCIYVCHRVSQNTMKKEEKFNQAMFDDINN
jgi:hypothetical protein